MNMTTEEIMIGLAEDINKVTDKPTREIMINRFLSELHRLFNNECVRYEDGAVYNDYVNWDANCGCVIVKASVDLEALVDYMTEHDTRPTLSNAWRALCDICERSENWYDVIDEGEQLIDIDCLKELMEIKNENIGEDEFRRDFEEYMEGVKMNERIQIYDRLSKVLTEYEEFVNGKGDDSQIYERAADMYEVLVEIQNKWLSDLGIK